MFSQDEAQESGLHNLSHICTHLLNSTEGLGKNRNITRQEDFSELPDAHTHAVPRAQKLKCELNIPVKWSESPFVRE